MTQSRFSYRVLTSFFVTFDFLILLVTGVVLYVVPPGRVANWTNWELMGLSKDQWTSVHILSALLFLLVSILHLIFNWKPFKHYFYHKLQGVHRLRELSLALLISGFFFYSGVSSVKPLAYVLDWGESLKESWVDQQTNDQSRGQPQMQSLAVISTRLNLEPGKVQGALRTAGFSIPSLDSTLENIASENQISPKDLYALIQEIESFEDESVTPPLQEEKQDFTEQKGFGRLNLQEALQELGEPLSEVMAYAKKQDIRAEAESRVKDLAESMNLTPMEYLDRLLPGKGILSDHEQ